MCKLFVAAAAFLATLLLALVLTATSAAADAPPCNPRDQVIAQLADRYKEAPIAAGITTKGSLVEVLTSADGKTWTIIVSTPQGLSCVVAAGEEWRVKPQPAAGEAS